MSAATAGGTPSRSSRRTRTRLPFLVEHWYLGSRTRRYMMVRRFREVLGTRASRPASVCSIWDAAGRTARCWADASGARVAGVDLELDQLRWARGALDPTRRLGLSQANAAALPVPNASIDRAVSVEMMEHVFRPDRPRVFSEIARVLKPGGRLALSTPNPASPIEAVKRCRRALAAGCRRALPSSCFPEAGDDRGAYHPYRYHHPLEPRRVANAGSRRAGFRVEGAKRFLWVMKTMPDACSAARAGPKRWPNGCR